MMAGKDAEEWLSGSSLPGIEYMGYISLNRNRFFS
jgi:hypothetical protein